MLLGSKVTRKRLGQSAVAKSLQGSPQGHRAPEMRPNLEPTCLTASAKQSLQ